MVHICKNCFSSVGLLSLVAILFLFFFVGEKREDVGTGQPEQYLVGGLSFKQEAQRCGRSLGPVKLTASGKI